MNNKAHLRPKDFDNNGDIIPMACKEEKGDFISRSELKKAIEKEICNFELPISANEIMPIIDNAPTVEERPQGEWIRITRKGTVPVEYVCSCCGRKIYDEYVLSIPMSEFYPFCHCGAKMKGGEEE